MNMTRTQWFDGQTNPIHFGEYEFSALWTEDEYIFKAEFSHLGWNTPASGKNPNMCWLNSDKDLFKWRGLVDKPKETK